MQTFPTSETTFLIPGSAGDLEITTTPSEKNLDATAIICHPHPLHGGTMNNKVVTTLARTFRDLGLRTVRFNFRGVGKSCGKFAEGKGEIDDLLAVVQWVKKACPNDSISLAGFSFGAYVATKVAEKINPTILVTVAPAITNFPLNNIKISCPWIIVQGEQDEIISAKEVFAWLEKLNPKPTLIKMQTGHFFHGKLVELKERLRAELGSLPPYI